MSKIKLKQLDFDSLSEHFISEEDIEHLASLDDFNTINKLIENMDGRLDLINENIEIIESGLEDYEGVESQLSNLDIDIKNNKKDVEDIKNNIDEITLKITEFETFKEGMEVNFNNVNDVITDINLKISNIENDILEKMGFFEEFQNSITEDMDNYKKIFENHVKSNDEEFGLLLLNLNNFKESVDNKFKKISGDVSNLEVDIFDTKEELDVFKEKSAKDISDIKDDISKNDNKFITIENDINLLEETKADIDSIPTKTSELENDSKYLTSGDIDLSFIEEDINNIKETDLAQDSKLTNIDETIDEIITKNNSNEEDILELIKKLNDYYTKEEHNKHVDDRISQLVGDAPEALDTLVELADALGNDPNFATTIINKLNDKVDKVEGMGLTENNLTDDLFNKLKDIKHITKLSELEQDIPHLKESYINTIEEDVKTNNELIINEIERVEKIIDNIEIPTEVNLKPIYEKLELLKTEKLDISEFETRIEQIVKDLYDHLEKELLSINENIDTKINSIDIPTKMSEIEDDIDLENRLYLLEENKASKKELGSLKNEIITIINNIPETDLTELEDSINKLSLEKISSSDAQDVLNDFKNELNENFENEKSEMYIDINSKADIDDIPEKFYHVGMEPPVNDNLLWIDIDY